MGNTLWCKRIPFTYWISVWTDSFLYADNAILDHTIAGILSDPALPFYWYI